MIELPYEFAVRIALHESDTWFPLDANWVTRAIERELDNDYITASVYVGYGRESGESD